MKNWFFLFILICTQSSAVLAEESTFSVSSWGQELKKNLDSNPSKASQMLSTQEFQKLEKSVLKPGQNSNAVVMTRARNFFAQERFAEALELYSQVERGADSWLEAVEEKGWTYHRQKDYEKALAQTKTLLSQAFTPVVGSEPFFLQSLSQLKICDYKGILETHKLFKDSQRQRLVALKALGETGESPAMAAVLQKANDFPLTFSDVAEEAKSLPRQFYRDIPLQKAMMEIKMSRVALDELEKHGKIDASHAAVTKTLKQAEKNLKSRLQELADIENEENFKIVQKLNLIEVETIQRIHADQKLDRNKFRKGQFAKVDRDQMVFPDDGHPWVDELDKYQVKVNSCPENIRRKM